MNVLIADVDGKNATFAARVLTEYARNMNLDCKTNEMKTAWGGGSVVTHVRFGETVYSPTVWEGGADAVMSFDVLEAARIKHYLGAKGILLVNDSRTETPFVNGASYPEGLKTTILEEINGAYFIDGDRLAQGKNTLPVVMLGAFTRLLKLDKTAMLEIINGIADNADQTTKAFESGYSFLK